VIFDEIQAPTVDQIEAGQRINGQVRFAFQVPDLKAACNQHSSISLQNLHFPEI
jgi:hypothetical protein